MPVDANRLTEQAQSGRSAAASGPPKLGMKDSGVEPRSLSLSVERTDMGDHADVEDNEECAAVHRGESPAEEAKVGGLNLRARFGPYPTQSQRHNKRYTRESGKSKTGSAREQTANLSAKLSTRQYREGDNFDGDCASSSKNSVAREGDGQSANTAKRVGQGMPKPNRFLAP